MTRPLARSATDFTIADVLAWARTKPADERYDFCDAKRCAISQFGLETRRKHLVNVDYLTLAFPQLTPAMPAIALSVTFGELVSGLERIVEPSRAKRVWKRLTGKPIGSLTFTFGSAPYRDTWIKPAAYMTDIDQVPA